MRYCDITGGFKFKDLRSINSSVAAAKVLTQEVTTHIKKIIARLYSFTLRSKLTEKQYYVRNFD